MVTFLPWTEWTLPQSHVRFNLWRRPSQYLTLWN